MLLGPGPYVLLLRCSTFLIDIFAIIVNSFILIFAWVLYGNLFSPIPLSSFL